jgi:hypothetical protein
MRSNADSHRTISPGAILVEESTLLPEPLHLENESDGNGWARVANNVDDHQLEKALATAGWTFFYVAGTVSGFGFGFERQKMIDGALKRLIRAVSRQKCNCLEIDEVTTRTFLGMPYVSISAHARHIQNAMVFADR